MQKSAKGKNQLVNGQVHLKATPRVGGAGVMCEPLERRALLTSVVVNTIQDGLFPAGSGTISLRNAVATANAATDATTISFDPTVFATAQTILLGGSGLNIASAGGKPITIAGPSAGVTISGNNVTGGFIIASEQSASFSNMTITQFTSSGIDFIGGGSTTSLALSNVTVSNNETAEGGRGGGGIYIGEGTVTATNLNVLNNTLDDAGGGGIYIDDANVTLTNVNISGNTSHTIGSAYGGGGIINADGTLTITDGTISDNTGIGSGGGIENSGILSLTNTTVSGNSGSQDGGGIYNDDTATLINVDVVGNSVVDEGNVDLDAGGGLYNPSASISSTATTTIGNSIIADNTSAAGGQDVDGPIISKGYNIVGKTDLSSGWFSLDQTGTVASPLDPKLSPLADNGGFAQTLLPMTGSPAIDKGFNALLPSGITTDERGLARIRNGTVDVGAVEVQAGSVAGASSITQLSASASNIAPGASITFTAAVSGGSGTPTGVVTFLDNGASIGTGTLDATGKATLTTTSLPAGNNSITVTYAGNSAYAGSSSVSNTITVSGTAVTTGSGTALTTTVLTVPSFNTLINTPVTFTATVTSATPGTVPTGTVTFYYNFSVTNFSSQVVPVASDGTAAFSISAPGLSYINVTAAVYSGDNTYATSTSGPVTVNANTGPATVAATRGNIPLSIITGAATKGVMDVFVTNASATPIHEIETVDMFMLGFDAGSTPILVGSVKKNMSIPVGHTLKVPVPVKLQAGDTTAEISQFIYNVFNAVGAASISYGLFINITAPTVLLGVTSTPLHPSIFSTKKSAWAYTIIVTNTGNIDATGSITFDTTAFNSATSVSFGTGTFKAHIKAGKSQKFTVHGKYLGTGTFATGVYDEFISATLNGVTGTGDTNNAFTVS